MANPLRIANKSNLIEEKSKLLFTELKSQFDKGQIKTPTELAYKTYMALEEMFTQLGKPGMRKRYALGPPISAHYNDMMKEIYNDIKTLFAESKLMTDSLQESFQQVEIERQGLTWQVSELNDRLNGIGLMMTQTKSEIIFRESFLDSTKSDVSIIKDDAAAISPAEGILTLMKIEAEDYRNNVTVRILNGNGFLGNTHQVRSLNGAYKFYGEEDVNVELLNIMDGNTDTWVEYELYSIPNETRNATFGYGFDYKEGMKWIAEDSGNLFLELEIELPVAKTLNWVSLSPFIPTDKGATPAVVRHVVIQDGKGSYNEVSGGYDLLRDDYVYSFPRQLCKKIFIRIEQFSSYETLVGHIFFKELDSVANSYMEKDRELDGRRIDGEKPSVEMLGYLFDPATQTLIQPSRTEGESEPLDEEAIKAALFQLPEVEGQLQSGLEAVLAKRFLIGLRDVNMSSYRFSSSSEYVSVSYESKDEITAIELAVSEQIPDELGEGEWIKYAISIDNGKEWHTIYPRGTTGDKKIKYIINERVPEEGRYDNYGYLDTPAPVRNVRLRILLERPTTIQNADYYTPIVKEYKLYCETAKGGNS